MVDMICTGKPRLEPLLAGRLVRAFRKVAVVCMASLAAALVGLPPSTAQAHGGLSMDSDICKLRLGPYNMHFTGYQPDSDGNKEFCEDIPKVGPTVIVMDEIEPELRDLPIEVRIISDTGNENDLDAITLVHLAPKVYVSGSVPLEYTFEKAGRYVGLVTAGEQGQYVSRFPFSVGVKRPPYGKYALLLGTVLLGFGLYRYSGRARRKAEMASGQTN